MFFITFASLNRRPKNALFVLIFGTFRFADYIIFNNIKGTIYLHFFQYRIASIKSTIATIRVTYYCYPAHINIFLVVYPRCRKLAACPQFKIQNSKFKILSHTTTGAKIIFSYIIKILYLHSYRNFF